MMWEIKLHDYIVFFGLKLTVLGKNTDLRWNYRLAKKWQFKYVGFNKISFYSVGKCAVHVNLFSHSLLRLQ